jgi:hypothetical protein
MDHRRSKRQASEVVCALQEFEVKPRRVHIERIDVRKFTSGDFPEVSG